MREFLRWFMFFPMFETPSGASGGGSSEPTPEQLRKQVAELQAKYDGLKKQVDDGDFVPKERFVGMQQTYQHEQEEHKKTKGSLDVLSAEKVTLAQQLSKLEEEKNSLATTIDERAIELETLTRAQKRTQLILKDFPHLAGFEVEGLLPDGDEKDWPTLFGNFATKINEVQQNAAKEFGKGGSTTTPPSKDTIETPAVRDSKAILKEATEALLTDDPARQIKYDKLMDEYFATQLQESVAKK